jgi:hypothetical protein
MSSWSHTRARGGPQFDVIALTTLGLAPWLAEWRWTTEKHDGRGEALSFGWSWDWKMNEFPSWERDETEM